jgi:hypothetical protein
MTVRSSFKSADDLLDALSAYVSPISGCLMLLVLAFKRQRSPGTCQVK